VNLRAATAIGLKCALWHGTALLKFLWKMMSGRHLKMPLPNKESLYLMGRMRPRMGSRTAFSQRLVQLITFGKIPCETLSSESADCASIGID
jgi:hypothetical protein